MPPPLASADFDFSLGEDVAFSPCAPQLESSALPQLPLQSLPSPKLYWRDIANQHEKALGDALEENSQLRETLARRQEELTLLRESNVQLKELASQARQLAAVLDRLVQPQCPDGAALPPPPATATAVPGSWGAPPERREEPAGVDTMLRQVSDKCRAALRSLGHGPEPKRPRRAPELHGAFHGLCTGHAAPRPGGDVPEEGGCLHTALGQAGSIRTLAFPQGSAFSLRTAGGGYRFRWVPR
ncbi:multicilin-like [Struthio camelus]|uniref:multicilin-like n=1 Tax=Struthio camelus TaxID=8801 RepID=UPI003603C5A2